MRKQLVLIVAFSIFVLLSIEILSPLVNALNGSFGDNAQTNILNNLNSASSEPEAMPIDFVEDLPVQISLSLSNTVSFSRETFVVASIMAQVDIEEVNVQLVLPDTIESIGSLNFTSDLQHGIAKQFYFPIKAISTGNCCLQVVATSKSLGNLKDASQSIYISTSDTNNIVSSTANADSISQLESNAVGTISSTSNTIGSPGMLTVFGYFYYTDGANVQKPIRYARVELWDDDSPTDVKLATNHTDSDGHYQFPAVDNNDGGSEGGYDIYVKVYCNSDIEVYVTTTDSATYGWVTTTFNDVADGSYNMGSYVASTTNRGCFGLYDAVIDEYWWLYNRVSWSRTQVQIRWPCEAWPHSHGNRMDIPSGSEWDTLTTYHEYAHCIHYAVRGGSFPSGTGPDPHYIDSESSAGFALTEGWAEFMECAVSNNPNGLDVHGYISIESTTLADGVPPPYVSHGDFGDWDGNIVEGAVANVFWDMFDGVSSADHPSYSSVGDNINSDFAQLWSIFRNYQPSGIAAIWSNWTPKNTDSWAIFYNNRVSVIDGYEPDNSFSQYSSMTVTTSLDYQSRSLEPAADNDYIRFYANPGNYTFYTSSTIDTRGSLYSANQILLTTNDNGAGALQFQINYSIASSGYYFLRVQGFSSATNGPYTLYFKYLPSNSHLPLPPNLVTPSNGAILTIQNVLFLWNSSTGATSYQLEVNGSSSLNYNTSSTTYTDQSLASGSYTWRARAYNSSGWGDWSPTWSFTLDTAPPTGSVTINGDAAYTNTMSVTLTLYATDISGTAQMRFSNDNIAWSSWETYATSKNWTILSGDGTKTVYAQFKDNLGFISSVYSDSIILDTTIPIANAGQSQTATQGNTVTFDASGSGDVSGIASYLWNFGDGATGSGVTTSHIYSMPGTYVVTLTVMDFAGNTAISTVNVTINPQPTPTPTATPSGGGSGGSSSSSSTTKTSTPAPHVNPPPTPTPTTSPTKSPAPAPPTTAPTATPQPADQTLTIVIIIVVAIGFAIGGAAIVMARRKSS